MRFSDQRYYIEQYIKCANCGVLIYDQGVGAADTPPYCSDWCVEWAAKRAAGDKDRVVPLPRG